MINYVNQGGRTYDVWEEGTLLGRISGTSKGKWAACYPNDGGRVANCGRTVWRSRREAAEALMRALEKKASIK